MRRGPGRLLGLSVPMTMHDARSDLLAGLLGAMIVLPQAIAYALIAGLPPEYGLYTAMVTPIIAALFGSSLHMVSGPTAAISVLVGSVLSQYGAQSGPEYVSLAITLAFLVGVIQLLFAVARMGALVNFISHTVLIGFTSGAAFIIASSQLTSVLGSSPAELLDGGRTNLIDVAWSPEQTLSILLATITLAVFVACTALSRRLPALLVAITAGGLAALALGAEQAGVQMVGAVPGTLPPLSMPVFSFGTLQGLVPGAAAIAVLGLIEAAAIARALAAKSQQRLDGNREFFGQGLSNVVGSFFSCYPGSGSFTRSGANYDAGARTPLATVFAAAMLAVVVVAFPWLSAYLPVPVMGALVMIIAWRLIDWAGIVHVIRSSPGESVVLLGTFGTAIFISLEFAIAVGVVLSLLFFLRQTARPGLVPVAPHPKRPHRGFRNASKHQLSECPQLLVLRVDGSVFFGAVDHVQQTLRRMTAAGRSSVLLVCTGVSFIDLSGGEMLVQEARRLRAEGGDLYLCGLRDPVRESLDRAGYSEEIGTDHLLGDPDTAIRQLVPNHMDLAVCRNCEVRIFSTCPPSGDADEERA
ncbi:MAG: SulP family inorganic anion transporter [Ectothiorhodospiraceae bacterium]|nr:SulP family inorganic anion transporter [Ectothiorhodospiraceae bacterium]